MRIAILDNTTTRWTASASFTRMLAHSLLAACEGTDCEVAFLSKVDAPAGVKMPTWHLQQPQFFPGEVTLRRLSGKPRKTALDTSLLHHRVDVVVPLLELKQRLPVPCIGWIPDFQAAHLPAFFSDEERAHHEQLVKGLVSHASRILLSSNNARDHLAEAAPGAEAKAEAIPFPSLFAFETPSQTLSHAAERYHLPKKFALIANQFWAHKNHGVVIEALRLLAARGIHIPLVCTGLPLDHRTAGNRPLSDLLQAIATAGVHHQVHVLGAIPFADLIDLMRQAAVIIQPSRFEGWSTVVQDAKALGRPVLCSDLAVHREQAPGALGFFGVDQPEALARLLEQNWNASSEGPDLSAEEQALAQERTFAKEHGRKLLALCRAAAGTHA